MHNQIPIERARQLLDYDPATGALIWRVDRGRGVKAGNKAGATARMGYVQVAIDGKLYRGHRVAFAIHYGRQPQHELDHIDGNTANNRIENLREATHFENQHNTKRPINNSTGIKGVHRRKNGKYQASFIDQGRKLHFGYFVAVDDAKAAVRAAREKLHGAFARHE
jgi:hypothetical protein